MGLWLDSAYPLNKPETDPGIKRGDCPGGIESTPTYLRQTYPNGYVTFKNAAVGEIGSTTDFNPKPPSPTPTPSTEGCYSNNYKNCIPNGYTSDGTYCNKGWLPNGAEKNCVALWGNCSGDIGEASCVPPTSVTSNPTSAPPTCSKKGEFCKKNSDCCKSKCIKKKKKCKK